MFATVHVDFKVDLLADAEIPKLCLFEIRVHPDVAKRANRHQALPDLDVVSRIHISSHHHSINFRNDGAIAEVQLGLIEIALCALQLGLGLLQSRRILNNVGIDLVDVASGIALVEFLDQLFWSQIVRG